MHSRLSRALEAIPIGVAVASLLFTSAAYGWYSRTGTPLLGMDASWLVAMVNLEFLAVHSFPFLMIVLLQRPRLPQWQGVRVLAAALLLLVYLMGAHSIAGFHGIALFVSLTALTYLGFLVNLEERIHKLPELGLRWLFNFILLVLLLTWFDLPSEAATWEIGDGILPVGGLYFLGLAGLELSGLYRDPALLKAGREIPGSFAQITNARSPSPELQSAHGPWYWALVPILGSAALNFLPLLLAGYTAGAGARVLDARIEWPRSALIWQWWFPSVVASILLAARCCQFHLLTRGRARLRARTLTVLVLLYLGAAVLRYRADPTYHFDYSLFPEDAYEGFLWLEVPLLFFLVPATWLAFAFPKARNRT